MNERSKMISKMMKGRDTRESYIRSKLSVLLPAQIRSLRLRRELTQAELGSEADMKQARISSVERIGEVRLSIETLVRLASAFRVGLIVKFASLSEMLNWENSFAPDEFSVTPLELDEAFLHPESGRGEHKVSPGLSAAMLGEETPVSNMQPIGPGRNIAASYSSENLVSCLEFSASEASCNARPKAALGSASMGATINQSADEQGYAA